MYCNTNQSPSLPFCGPHPKPHGARGLSNQYHLRFDPKIGHGICAIIRIPCACVACTSVLEKPRNYGIPLKQTHTTNLSQNLLTGHFSAHITIGISFTCHRNQHFLRCLVRYIRLLLTE